MRAKLRRKCAGRSHATPTTSVGRQAEDIPTGSFQRTTTRIPTQNDVTETCHPTMAAFGEQACAAVEIEPVDTKRRPPCNAPKTARQPGRQSREPPDAAGAYDRLGVSGGAGHDVEVLAKSLIIGKRDRMIHWCPQCRLCPTLHVRLALLGVLQPSTSHRQAWRALLQPSTSNRQGVAEPCCNEPPHTGPDHDVRRMIQTHPNTRLH